LLARAALQAPANPRPSFLFRQLDVVNGQVLVVLKYGDVPAVARIGGNHFGGVEFERSACRVHSAAGGTAAHGRIPRRATGHRLGLAKRLLLDEHKYVVHRP
jgi:hypothetical protein